MATLKDSRVKKHLAALHAAATKGDPEAFANALRGIRDDGLLNPVQRGALLKTIAQEQAAGFAYAMTGKPPRS